MLTALVENTNLYSVQKDGKSVETDKKEVEKLTDMLTRMVENTNLYSVQKNRRAVDTDVREVEKVLGMFLLMGIVRMPGVRYY